MVFHLFAQQNMSNVSLLEYIVLTERIYSSHSKFATLGALRLFTGKYFYSMWQILSVELETKARHFIALLRYIEPKPKPKPKRRVLLHSSVIVTVAF